MLRFWDRCSCFCSRKLWSTEEFVVDSITWSCTGGFKTSPNYHHSTTLLHSGMRCLSQYVVLFLPNILNHTVLCWTFICPVQKLVCFSVEIFFFFLTSLIVRYLEEKYKVFVLKKYHRLRVIRDCCKIWPGNLFTTTITVKSLSW